VVPQISLQTFPQRLKPHSGTGVCGTAEAVPFQDEVK
jgi:hypothetical protein